MMSVKSELLKLLSEKRGDRISGEEIGRRLNCSRAAVSKAVTSLRREGYAIRSKTNYGYVLEETSSLLCADGIRAGLHDRQAPVTVFDEVGSTNRAARRLAVTEEAPHGTVIAARRQTQGLGRFGRPFYSPEGGLYLSVVLRPKGVQDGPFFTTAAAVAACRAVEAVCHVSLSIKWVNDLYLNQKKVGGILTEASTDFESGSIEFVVVGVGLNLYEPDGGFAQELLGSAGAILEDGAETDINALAAGLVNCLMQEVERETVSPLYMQRNIVPGRRVTILDKSGAYEARADRILPDGRLVVYEDTGRERILACGEVSLRLS